MIAFLAQRIYAVGKDVVFHKLVFVLDDSAITARTMIGLYHGKPINDANNGANRNGNSQE